ncbi:MAG: hypothetical protein IPK30_03110 [Cellvibrionales bacterium]|nr:hypothetical protein [Cellvibrionales bacterium]
MFYLWLLLMAYFSWILKVLSNIAAVIIGLVMALLLAEVLVRIFLHLITAVAFAQLYSHLFEYDKLLGWRG